MTALVFRVPEMVKRIGRYLLLELLCTSGLYDTEHKGVNNRILREIEWVSRIKGFRKDPQNIDLLLWPEREACVGQTDVKLWSCCVHNYAQSSELAVSGFHLVYHI